MIDFLLRYRISIQELRTFIALVVGVSVDEVVVCQDAEFYEKAGALDLSSCRCLCVFSYVHGEAAMLLQLFRCEMSAAELKGKIISSSSILGVECYIPDPVGEGWVYVGVNGVVSVRRVCDDDEEHFYFE
ncbi:MULTISPECIES: hypothetical protein [Pseudomonas]|uniref:hypothetical protein n=1 Tax=Pseudomonas TaxID=286 RepID=UPI001BCF3539|nr:MULTISPECIES: hypothetical protein [Pseudomonas]UXY50982.1 hypothetical protein N9L84_18650 [Pseudomonas tohonis]